MNKNKLLLLSFLALAAASSLDAKIKNDNDTAVPLEGAQPRRSKRVVDGQEPAAPEAPQPVVQPSAPVETPQQRRQRLRFQAEQNRQTMNLFSLLAENEKALLKVVDALVVAHNADKLRAMMNAGVIDESLRADVVAKLPNFLEYFSMDPAKELIRESLDLSNHVDMNEYKAAGVDPFLLAIFNIKKQQEKEQQLKQILADDVAFKKLLHQISALHEVLMMNLPPKAGKAIQPHYEARIRKAKDAQ